MRSVFIILISVFAAFRVQAGDIPFSGKQFTISYNPSEKGILSNSGPISLVYVFDYWGTKGIYSGGATALYQNVLEPDSGRTKQVELTRNGKQWSTTINIPTNVSILSYYFTDGNIIEDNNFKTYVHYIYGKDKKPVRLARFRNVDFLVMAGKPEADQISEIKKELLEYPDNFMAYVPLWRMKFKSANDFKDLFKMQMDFEKEFTDLRNKFGESDSLLLAEVSIYYNWYPNIDDLVKSIFSKTTFFDNSQCIL